MHVLLKHLSNFWDSWNAANTLWNNSWSNLVCELCYLQKNKVATFAVTHVKLYVPVVTLSTPHNAELVQQLK